MQPKILWQWWIGLFYQQAKIDCDNNPTVILLSEWWKIVILFFGIKILSISFVALFAVRELSWLMILLSVHGAAAEQDILCWWCTVNEFCVTCLYPEAVMFPSNENTVLGNFFHIIFFFLHFMDNRLYESNNKCFVKKKQEIFSFVLFEGVKTQKNPFPVWKLNDVAQNFVLLEKKSYFFFFFFYTQIVCMDRMDGHQHCSHLAATLCSVHVRVG